MNLGFIVESFGVNQLSYNLCLNSNKVLENPHNHVMGFKLHQEFFVEYPKFCILEALNAWNFEGILVSTNIRTTKILDKCILAQKKYFYVWDLEWMTLQNPNYLDLLGVYSNSNIELIARSESHAALITKCWKKPIMTMENFNYEQLLKL